MTKLDLSKFKLQEYACPVCGNIGDRQQHKKIFTIQGFKIVRCPVCTMTFVNPRICNEQIVDIYRFSYFQRRKDGYDNYESIAHLRIQTFEKWYGDILPFLKSKDFDKLRALDIGCAAGYFLNVLEKQNWEAEGIELDQDMYQLLVKRGYKVSNVPLEEFTSPHQFDLITMFDVLEHLPALQDDFAKLSDLLLLQGLLVIATPNIDSTQRKMFGNRWFQFKPIEHLYYFSPVTIKKLAQKNGLRIEAILNSGQYADIPFISDRLKRYGFSFFARFLNALVKLLGLKNLNWYADTGSMFVVLRKIK
jgi:2-polyprenyl-3-methyl-5-hydroxy-6-metoxy-1,4-benzoquinol methylase